MMCLLCGQEGKFRCSACNTVSYCKPFLPLFLPAPLQRWPLCFCRPHRSHFLVLLGGASHQKADWRRHKRECFMFAKVALDVSHWTGGSLDGTSFEKAAGKLESAVASTSSSKDSGSDKAKASKVAPDFNAARLLELCDNISQAEHVREGRAIMEAGGNSSPNPSPLLSSSFHTLPPSKSSGSSNSSSSPSHLLTTEQINVHFPHGNIPLSAQAVAIDRSHGTALIRVCLELKVLQKVAQRLAACCDPCVDTSCHSCFCSASSSSQSKQKQSTFQPLPASFTKKEAVKERRQLLGLRNRTQNTCTCNQPPFCCCYCCYCCCCWWW